MTEFFNKHFGGTDDSIKEVERQLIGVYTGHEYEVSTGDPVHLVGNVKIYDCVGLRRWVNVNNMFVFRLDKVLAFNDIDLENFDYLPLEDKVKLLKECIGDTPLVGYIRNMAVEISSEFI